MGFGILFIYIKGCCLYIMLTGNTPFENSDQIITGVYSKINQKLSEGCKELLNLMLEKRIEFRGNINDITNHSWLN